MLSLKLLNNSGFGWFSTGDISAKGFLFAGEKYYKDSDLPEYFSDAANWEQFVAKLRDANGRFSVIVRKSTESWVAVDPIRLFPLYYLVKEGELYISDHAYALLDDLEHAVLNETAAMEFLAAGYVTGNETLVEGLKQVQAGEALRIEKGKVSPEFYYTYTITTEKEGDYASCFEAGKKVFEAAFKRFIRSLDNRTVLVPLSGGYDSRLIVTMLKHFGYSKVICFTYGRRTSEEISISEKVAKELGYPWYYVEYTDELIAGYLETEEFRSYYPVSSGLVSMFYMQEYFAVKYLKDKALIPPDSLFAPGHSGDFLGGSQLIKHNNLKKEEAFNVIAGRLYSVKYIFRKPGLPGKRMLIKRLENSLKEKQQTEASLAFSVHEDWDFKEKLAKFNFNSVRIYDFFGYGYRLPFWDGELLGFFRFLPLPYKLNKQLYNDILKKEYFEKYNVSFERELQVSPKQIRKMHLKGKVKRFLPQFIKRSFLNMDDGLFYREITAFLTEDMRKQGIKLKIYNNSYNSLLIQWYLFRTREFLKEYNKA